MAAVLENKTQQRILMTDEGRDSSPPEELKSLLSKAKADMYCQGQNAACQDFRVNFHTCFYRQLHWAIYGSGLAQLLREKSGLLQLPLTPGITVITHLKKKKSILPLPAQHSCFWRTCSETLPSLLTLIHRSLKGGGNIITHFLKMGATEV